MTKEEEDRWRKHVYTVVRRSSKKSLMLYLENSLVKFKDVYGTSLEEKVWHGIDVVTDILETRGVCKEVKDWYKKKEPS